MDAVEQVLELFHTFAQVNMTWWVSATVIVGSLLGVVWVRRDKLQEAGRTAANWVCTLVSVFIFSVIAYGVLMIVAAIGLRYDLHAACQDANVDCTRHLDTFFVVTPIALVIGTSSFVIAFLIWLGMWRRIIGELPPRQKSEGRHPLPTSVPAHQNPPPLSGALHPTKIASTELRDSSGIRGTQPTGPVAGKGEISEAGDHGWSHASASGGGVITDMHSVESGRGVRMGLVLTRLETYLVEHYLGLHVTVVSVALGIAGLAAADILAAHDRIPPAHHALLGTLWVASLLATAVAFAGAVVGSFMSPTKLPSMWDLVLPLLLAVAEFFLFAVLAPTFIGVTGSDSATESAVGSAVARWFFCLAVFGVVATVHILRVRAFFDSGSYAPDLQDKVAQYRKRLLFPDTAGASAVSIVGVAAGTVELLRLHVSLWTTYALALVVIGLLVGALVGHGRTTQLWRQVISREAHAPVSPAATSAAGRR